MTRRLIKVILLWNVVLTVLLLVSLAGNAAFVQAANDPPVRVYTANTDDVGGSGGATTSNKTISTTSPHTLITLTTTNLSAAHPHVCILVASANPLYTETSGVYIFGVSMDDPTATASASNRRIEMFNNPSINDDTYEEVSTTYAFYDVSGGHTFFFSARKHLNTDGNLTVDASSMSLICVKKPIS